MATTPATAPRPVRAQSTPVRHTASNNRVTRIGYAAKVTMSDGTVQVCEHSHRDRNGPAITRCAQTIVNAANAPHSA